MKKVNFLLCLIFDNQASIFCSPLNTSFLDYWKDQFFSQEQMHEYFIGAYLQRISFRNK